MRYISLGSIDRNSIPIFIGCIFSFLSRLLYNYDGIILFKHSIISNIVSAFSRVIMLIPLIILKIRTKKINIDENDNKDRKNSKKGKLLYTNSKKIIIRGKYWYIILSSIIFFIQGIMLLYTIEIKTNFWISEILITCIFYYLIFKIKLHKHHYSTIILIILTGIILDLVFENLQNDLSNRILLFFIRFTREILYSLHDVVNKYLMEKKFCSPYEICFYNGLIGLILLTLFSILNYYYFDMDNFEEYLDKFNTIELLAAIGYLITQLGLYLFSLITNKKNTPCHIFIIYVFGQLAYYMDFSANSIILIFCLIFILFLSLIFNEIIEINIWGLSDDTKRRIRLRAEEENTDIEKDKEIDENDDIVLKEENNDNDLLIELVERKEDKE